MIGNKAILLTYSNRNRIIFQKYAEFFRFIGVYTGENLIEDIEEAKKLRSNQDFDAEYNVDECDGSAEDLGKKFSQLFEKTGLDSEEEPGNNELNNRKNRLIEVFNNYHLLQASMTLQYFNIENPVVGLAGELFKNAAEDLEKFCSDSEGNMESCYEIRYAILYCKQKANQALALAEGYLYYPIEELSKEALALQADFPEHSNTWMLIGLICEISKEYRMDAIEAFKKARDAVKDQPYASSILYRIGKNCEYIDALTRLRNDAFEEAYISMPKYRNIYKVARQYLNMEEWDLAIKFFEECIAKIKLRGDYLDPLEQEYYFKVNSHLAYIYEKKQDYVTAIEHAEFALDLRDKVYLEMEQPEGYNKMYFDIYKDMNIDKGNRKEESWSPQAMITLEVKRMSPKNVYRYLALSYQGLGMQDMADEYWSIVKA